MSKIEAFKNFVQNNPSLISYVKNGNKSWQDFYELYDLYGDNREAWKNYLKKDDNKNTRNSGISFSDVLDGIKNIDTDKIQDGIDSIQKAIALFGDIITKNNNESNGGNYIPRPVYRRFDD